MGDALLALVLSGQKQAICEFLRQFPKGEEPKPGDHWIITDGRKIPRCIIQTTQVDICEVSDVDAAFAWDEGEGDRSLAYWKREHDAYYQRSAMDLHIVTRCWRCVSDLNASGRKGKSPPLSFDKTQRRTYTFSWLFLDFI